MATSASQYARTVIGPLQTTFAPPSSCTNVVAGCPYSCTVGWRVTHFSTLLTQASG